LSNPGRAGRRQWRTPKRHVGRTLTLGCVGAVVLVLLVGLLAFSQCGKLSGSECSAFFGCETVNPYSQCHPEPCATSFGGLTVYVDKVQWNSRANASLAGKQLVVLTLHFENRGTKPQSTDQALTSFSFVDATGVEDKPELDLFPSPAPVDLLPSMQRGPLQVGFEGRAGIDCRHP